MLEASEEKSIVLRCRPCFTDGTKWEGMEVFANSKGTFLHCRVCNGFVAKCQPLNIDLDCDLCREGDKKHTHEDFRSHVPEVVDPDMSEDLHPHVPEQGKLQ